jgi:hypothetical protein
MFVITYRLPEIRREVPGNFWHDEIFRPSRPRCGTPNAGLPDAEKMPKSEVEERPVGKNLAKGDGKMQDGRT